MEEVEEILSFRILLEFTSLSLPRGVARIFKGGFDFLLNRAKQGASEASVAYERLCVFLELESLVGSEVKPWKTFHFQLHLKAPDCEKIDILSAFFSL